MVMETSKDTEATSHMAPLTVPTQQATGDSKAATGVAQIPTSRHGALAMAIKTKVITKGGSSLVWLAMRPSGMGFRIFDVHISFPKFKSINVWLNRGSLLSAFRVCLPCPC